jgi:hypothetical protein
METCTNCGTVLQGKYCHNCGQERVKRLEVKSIIHEVTHGILHWENSILKTFSAMLRNPGYTVKEYISGRRKSFIKPFSYFIFIQTIFVVVFHRMSEKYFAFLTVNVRSDSEKVMTRFNDIQHLVGQYINYLNYFMPVVFAFYFYLFFKKKSGVNFAESLAISFYWVGTTLVFSVILMLLSVIDVRTWNVRFGVNLLYYIFAIVTFSGLSYVKGILKGLAVTMLSYITFVLLVTMIILLYLYFHDGINVLKVFS